MDNNKATYSIDSEDEIEIDVIELIFEVLKHWKMIFASTVLVGAIFLAASIFFIIPQYESTSQLYVLSKSTSITNLTDLQMGSNLTNDYIVVVTGRPIVEQVIKNLGLDMSYEQVVGKISVENPTNSRILEITATDEDPAVAKSIADEIAEVAAAFISDKMDQDPPSIIQYGYADERPVSPNIKKNTAIGAAIGMLLAMAIVVCQFIFDDTIMTNEDVEKLGLNVLGTLPLENEAEYNGQSDSKKKASKKKGAESA